MKRMIIILGSLALLAAVSAVAQNGPEGYSAGVDYSRYIEFDRYLSVEVWTDQEEYYEGDDVRISFRADKDCYVVIYNIDTRGNVNLIYPTDRWDDAKIERDRVYRVPDGYDDYDLTVGGPEGVEYIQVVASLRPLPIPDWTDDYGPVCEDDPMDFLEYINAVYFAEEVQAPLAFDLTVIDVNEWHAAYYRPVYVHHYHDRYYNERDWWGTVYVDYPWGATIYIDGIYWGIAPLYIPRIYYGWHYVTVYDSWGYCWEERVNVFRRKSVVLDNTIIKTRAGTKSRYREVRDRAYLNPSKNGYPDFDRSLTAKKTAYDEYKRTGKVSATTAAKVRASRLGETATASKSSRSGATTSKSRLRDNEAYKSRSATKSRTGSDYSTSKRSTERSRATERTQDKASGTKSSDRSRGKSTTPSDDNSSYKKKPSSSKSSGSSGSSYDRHSSGSSKSSGNSSGSYKRSSSSSKSSSSGRSSSSSRSSSGSKSSSNDNNSGSSKSRGR